MGGTMSFNDEFLEAQVRYGEAMERLVASGRPMVSRRDWWVMKRENASFALFGFLPFRIRRWLRLTLARDQNVK